MTTRRCPSSSATKGSTRRTWCAAPACVAAREEGGGALRWLPPLARHASPLPSRQFCLVDFLATKAVYASASHQAQLTADPTLDPPLLTDAACAALTGGDGARGAAAGPERSA
eukprot:scaffold73047_cov45-Phaeocystis_antarctica.AAC.2